MCIPINKHRKCRHSLETKRQMMKTCTLTVCVQKPWERQTDVRTRQQNVFNKQVSKRFEKRFTVQTVVLLISNVSRLKPSLLLVSLDTFSWGNEELHLHLHHEHWGDELLRLVQIKTCRGTFHCFNTTPSETLWTDSDHKWLRLWV